MAQEHADSRESSLERLSENGHDRGRREDIRSLIGTPDSDLFDVLRYVHATLQSVLSNAAPGTIFADRLRPACADPGSGLSRRRRGARVTNSMFRGAAGGADRFAARAAGRMKTIVTGHQVDIGDSLRDHAVSHLEEHVAKYFADATDAHVTFSREGAGFRAHVSVHVGHDIHAEGHAEAPDPYTGFNLATEHVAKQLRRSKRKLRQHH